jgi:sulfite exporter TauE/SafE
MLIQVVPRSAALSSRIFYIMQGALTYAFIGGAAGFAGSLINITGGLSGIQNTVALMAGLFMIIMGVGILGLSGKISWLEKHNLFILERGRNILKGDSKLKYFPLGLLFGFLPCGFSMAAFAASAGTGSPVSGMLLSFFFGLGTIPSLILFGVAVSFISTRMRGLLYKAAGAMVILMGILFLIRGLRHYV